MSTHCLVPCRRRATRPRTDRCGMSPVAGFLEIQTRRAQSHGGQRLLGGARLCIGDSDTRLLLISNPSCHGFVRRCTSYIALALSRIVLRVIFSVFLSSVCCTRARHLFIRVPPTSVEERFQLSGADLGYRGASAAQLVVALPMDATRVSLVFELFSNHRCDHCTAAPLKAFAPIARPRILTVGPLRWVADDLELTQAREPVWFRR